MPTSDEEIGIVHELRMLRRELKQGFAAVRGDIDGLRALTSAGFERTTETRIDLADVIARLGELEARVGSLETKEGTRP